MKTLLRRMKAFLLLIKRLCYRLVCWINYPTPRERMWHMFYMGKLQGQQEALKTLPITQVQPRQATDPLKIHLPPGAWTRLYRETHGLHKVVLVPQAAPPGDDSWLNSPPPEVKNLLDPYNTEEMPAVVKLLHERRRVG